MRKTLAALLCASLTAAELPVRTVVLYKNGVGYFERSGEVPAGQAATLEFRAGEMNDVLKSLSLVDRTGGRVASVRYQSSIPLEQRLQEFEFGVGEQQSLAAFLDQLKGAEVEVRVGAAPVTGTIFAARQTTPERPAEGEKPAVPAGGRELLTLLLPGGELRTIDLGSVAGVRLTNAQLQQQLARLLQTMAQGRSSEKRTVTVEGGSAARTLLASYLLPAPSWKSSYRLLFQEGDNALLEGWAMVDNTSGEDWSGVKLALVSGRPISFVTQLYEPKYRARPAAELPDDPAQAPVMYENATAPAPLQSARLNQFEKVQENAFSRRAGVAGGTPGGVIGGVASDEVSVLEKMGVASKNDRVVRSLEYGRLDQFNAMQQAQAQGQDKGDLFEYRFDKPVTIAKGESALVPFVAEKVTARRLLVWSPGSGLHPRAAAEIDNKTGKTLDGGPITVFDGSSYAGEALMETLKMGGKRLIAYAVDLGTSISTKAGFQDRIVRSLRAKNGVLFTTIAQEQTQTYTVSNTDARAKTVLVEHPIRPQYKLLSAKPAETTPNYYRFAVKVGPNATAALPVTEEYGIEESYAVSSLAPDRILGYAANKSLSEAARKQLEAVVAQQRQIAATERQIEQLGRQTQRAEGDQSRVRENIRTLNGVPGQQEQVQRYAAQLPQIDARLEQLRAETGAAQGRLEQLKGELARMVEAVSF